MPGNPQAPESGRVTKPLAGLANLAGFLKASLGAVFDLFRGRPVRPVKLPEPLVRQARELAEKLEPYPSKD